MPIQANPLPIERARRAKPVAPARPPRPLPDPSAGAIRVLQNRQAPAQRSLFQQALPAR